MSQLSEDDLHQPKPGRGDDQLDQALLLRMERGDERALATLYDRHGAPLYTLAVRILNDRALAQEVVQDTFLSCWEQAGSYDPVRGRVSAWLTRVTRNRAVDVLRSRPHQARLREHGSLPRPDSADEPGSADPSEAIALRQFVRAALASLPADRRQAIELSYLGGLTRAEIAARLGEPIGTVKTRIHRGMDQLRERLAAGGGLEPFQRRGAR